MGIGTEKAFDVLPHVVELYEKLNVKAYVIKTKEKYKGKKVDTSIVGMDLFAFVLKNLNKAKDDVFQIIAILEDRTVEEVKAQQLTQTIKSIKKLFMDEEMLELFKSAM